MNAQLSRWLKEDEAKRSSDEQYDVVYYRQHMASIKSRINAARYSPRERHAIFELLELESRKLIETHKLLAAPVYPPVTLSRMESKRTLHNMHQAQKLRVWNARFKTRLVETASEAGCTASIWLGLALWSALSRACLCDAELLEALRLRLCNREPLFEPTIGGRLAIRLAVKAGSTVARTEGDRGLNRRKRAGRANLLVDSNYYHVLYFVPDSLTLVLIQRWLASDRENEVGGKTLDIIRHAIWRGEVIKARYQTLPGLCAQSAWLADDRPLPMLSEALGEVASGRWSALGVDDISHALLCGTPAESSPPRPVSAQPYARQKASTTKSDWTVFKRMQQALAKQGNSYQSSADMENALRPMLEMCDPDSAEHLILNWLLYLLVDLHRKPSTIATYHSRITARLLDAFEDQPLSALADTDFELAYRAIINDIAQPLMREQVAGRISQLHDFGVRHIDYRLPKIENIFDDESGVRFVRARHIPARHLPCIITAIKSQGTGSAVLAQFAQMALLLAYRGGLRLGEVVKLRIGDVEPSDDKWLFIVDNRFGTNKSSASRRQIPFAVLLSEGEREAFSAFVRDRHDRSSLNQPLFQDPATGDPLNAQWLSQTVSHALNDVLGGSGWTFHHLRHAAANNLFLAIEEETELCVQFASWSAKQCQQIRDQLLPNSVARQTRYFALAAFMGHADPRQTFESYLHVIEPVLARRRAWQPIGDEVELYAAALGVGTQRLNSLKTTSNNGDFRLI